MIPVEKIVEAIQEQAKQGSCKTCRWCCPYTEPEEFQPGILLTHECEIQGNVNPIWFTDANLDSRAYPWRCDEGTWTIAEGCMAYQPASAYPMPFDEDSRGKAIIQHREFLDDLAEAIQIYYAIRDNSLAKLTAKLNEATESLVKV